MLRDSVEGMGFTGSFMMDRHNLLAKGEAAHMMTLLPEDFAPGENDVICGRGRKTFMHSGNEKFRQMVNERLEEYSKTETKLEKSYILCDIVAQIRAKAPNGGFVKRDVKDGRWYEVGDFLSREKTSQAFRDALTFAYKSSNTSKKLRRQTESSTKLPASTRRAFSTSQLESQLLRKKNSYHEQYLDPLLVRLRKQKSLRPVSSRGDGEVSEATFIASTLGENDPFSTILGRQSCPNFNRSRISVGVLPASVLNDSTMMMESSTATFEQNAALESSVTGISNFDWGFSEVKSTPLKRINEVNTSKMNLFSKFTGNAMESLGVPRRHSADTESIDLKKPCESFDKIDFSLESTELEPLGGYNSDSSFGMLASILLSPSSPAPSKSSTTTALIENAGNDQDLPGTFDIEAKLRTLRRTTFEYNENAMPEVGGVRDTTSILVTHNEDEISDTFDKLVDMIGDMGSATYTDDPFEPNPLP